MSEQKPPQYPHPGFGKPGVKWTGDLEGVSYFRRGSGDNLECDYMDGDSTASAWTPVNEVDSLSSTTVRCTAARLAREDEAREAADRETVVEVMNAIEMQQCLEAAEREIVRLRTESAPIRAALREFVDYVEWLGSHESTFRLASRLALSEDAMDDSLSFGPQLLDRHAPAIAAVQNDAPSEKPPEQQPPQAPGPWKQCEKPGGSAYKCWIDTGDGNFYACFREDFAAALTDRHNAEVAELRALLQHEPKPAESPAWEAFEAYINANPRYTGGRLIRDVLIEMRRGAK